MRLNLFTITLAGLALSISALPGAAAANDPVYRVDLNKTQILRLPTMAGAVVIGNPRIADVTVHSPTMLMVVGRGFGETNLIVLDREGRTMVDADIQVTSITSEHGVRLFNAGARESYSCTPYCQPSPVLGDSPQFIGANAVGTSTSAQAGPIFQQGMPGPVGAVPPGFPGAPGGQSLIDE